MISMHIGGQYEEKIIYGITTVLAISLLTGCGAAKLKNGEELVAKVDNYKISADDLYSEMKEKYAVKTLIDNIDHQLLDTTYKTDETETKAIENQIEEIKKTYGSNDQIFEQIIKQVYNVESVDELKAMLSLDYKRDLAIKDYVKEKVVTDEEVTTYYDTKVIGDVKASHILIKPNAKDSDSEETKTKKENEAKKKAEEIIKKLDNGEDFAKLAKKYSDDKGTASKGGNLGYFNMDDDFEENFVSAAAALKKGAYSKEPVKTKYGYEIILKVDEKDKKKKDDLESTIRQTLADEKIKEDSSTTTYYKRLRDWRESKGLKFEDKELKKMYDKYMKTLTKEDENE